MKGNHRIIFITLLCIYLTAVALLCFLRPSSLPEVEIKTFLGLPIDKVLHFLMFLPYPILAGMSFISMKNGFLRSIIILTVVLTAGIGMAYGTELIQGESGYRAYEIADFHADLAGISAGSIIMLAYMTYYRLKK